MHHTSTLSEFDTYMQAVLGLSASTRRMYLSTVRRYLQQSLPPAEFAASGNPAERTVNQRRAALNLYLEWNGMAPCAGRSRVVHSQPSVPWAAESVVSLLSRVRTVYGARESCAGWLAYSGLRAGAIASLRLSDVYRQGEAVHLRIVSSKTARNRHIPLSRVAVTEMDWYLRVTRPAIVERATQALQRNQDALLLSDYGGAYRMKTLAAALYACAAELGFQSFIDFAKYETTGPVHALRHSCATHLHDQGMDSLDLQELLMHKSAASTQVYVKPSLQKLAREIDARHPGNVVNGATQAADHA